MSKKLVQVLEYLIAGKQDKAKALLHQVFIEKARKIHEDIMSNDDMEEDDVMGGDMGDDFRHDVMGKHNDHLRGISDEIDNEETMAEEEGDDMDDMGGDDVDVEDDDMMDPAMGGEDEMTGDEEGDDVDGEMSDDEEGDDMEPKGDEEEMDESWLDEDWDELAEAIELEKVKVPTSGEVGSGTYNSADANAKAKSPIATSQTSRMGAKPISVKDTPHRNYERETAPTSKSMDLSNRRKTAMTGMGKVSKEGNSPNAMINKTKSEFGADTVGKDSPLTKPIRK